jgi:hypothetical protein
VLEGYSRTILAGAVSEYQDLVSVLRILLAALNEYGCPDILVSDNGTVFRANRYQSILQELEIEPKLIEKGKPWQNLIEPQFKIQLRLADYKFEQAQSLEEIQNIHAEFIHTFNHTPHWAHKKRADNRRTPAQVLGWVRGRLVPLDELERLFQQLSFPRMVNQYGFVSIQRFYLYAERGLARQRVSVWIYEGSLRIEYQNILLAQYQSDYDPHQRRLQVVSHPTLYHTTFASPQLELFELDDHQWLKIRHRPYHQRQRRSQSETKQLLLPGLKPAV